MSKKRKGIDIDEIVKIWKSTPAMRIDPVSVNIDPFPIIPIETEKLCPKKFVKTQKSNKETINKSENKNL